MARIRNPIAKAGITQDMITKHRSDSGQKKALSLPHTEIEKGRERKKREERK